MSAQPTGSCRCAAVRYRIKKPIEMAANCHCTICKKITGASFASIAIVDEADLEFSDGQDLLTAYRITENAVKHFCSRCGTPIYSLHKGFPGRSMVALGSLDDPACVTPSVNVHCEHMLPWLADIGAMASFEREPPKKG